jgi:Zn/Cd-binding protein ZinT
MRQFRIDESERERILNLHETATKRQYLNEQGNDCIMINKVDDIDKVVKDVNKLNWLITLEGKKISKVCKGRPGTNYTFRSEENPELTVPSFTLDGDLKIGSKGA